MDIKIVQASLDDASEILALQNIAYQKEAAIYDDWNIPPLTQTLTEIKNELITKHFIKAIFNDRIISSVRGNLDYNTCMIGRLIVYPEYQNNGIGSLMMCNIENAFTNAKRFELFTGTKSIDNIRLYKKLGYREYRIQTLSPKVQIVFMEKHKK